MQALLNTKLVLELADQTPNIEIVLRQLPQYGKNLPNAMQSPAPISPTPV